MPETPFPFRIPFPSPGGGGGSDAPPSGMHTPATIRAYWDSLVDSGKIKPKKPPVTVQEPPPVTPTLPGAVQFAPTYPELPELEEVIVRPRRERVPLWRTALRRAMGLLGLLFEPMPSGGGDLRNEPIRPRKPPKPPPPVPPEEIEFPEWEEIADPKGKTFPRETPTQRPVVPLDEVNLPDALDQVTVDEPGVGPTPGTYDSPRDRPADDRWGDPGSDAVPLPGDWTVPGGSPKPAPTPRTSAPRVPDFMPEFPWDLLFPSPRPTTKRPSLPRREPAPESDDSPIVDALPLPRLDPVGTGTDTCSCADEKKRKKKRKKSRTECYQYLVKQRRTGHSTSKRVRINCNTQEPL